MIMTKAPRQTTHRNVQPYSIMSTTSDSMASTNRLQDSSRPAVAWSADDDARLMRCRAQGMNWGPIARQFPSKTPNACRKRHERLMEKKNAENWDGIKSKDLARVYMECREAVWKPIADRLGEKWNVIEAKCMEKGLKNLTNAGRPRRESLRTPSIHQTDNELDGPTLLNDTPSSSSPYMPTTRGSSNGPSAPNPGLPPLSHYQSQYGGGHSPSQSPFTKNNYSPTSTTSLMYNPNHSISLPRPSFDGGNPYTMGPSLPGLNSFLTRSPFDQPITTSH